MFFSVFRHVDSHQRLFAIEHEFSESLAEFSLTNTRGPCKFKNEMVEWSGTKENNFFTKSVQHVPKKINEAIGLEGSFKPARERWTASVTT